jgi:uncharacterized protein
MARMRRLVALLVFAALALPGGGALAPGAGAASKPGALAAAKRKAAKCPKAKNKSKKADAARKKSKKKSASCKKKKRKKANGPNLVPRDYSLIKGLSQPTYTEVETTTQMLPMSDGTNIYLEITKPKAEGHFGVILEASVYHGTVYDRTGTRILPGPTKDEEQIGLKGYFPSRGYAVVMMDLRGTGKSQGCLDHIGPKDRSDIKEVIDWAAKQKWSNGRVGILGHSYLGGTSTAGGSIHDPNLKTFVVSAGLGSMYEHQFQAGVPYNLQWAGPIEAYEQLTLQRYLPPEVSSAFVSAGEGATGDSFGQNLEYAGCGLPQASLVSGPDQLSGRYSSWDTERDFRAGATSADIPTFVIHGVNDQAARVISTEWFTNRKGKAGDKLWLGQWDHGIGCCPNRRGAQWTYAIQAWFDKHLLQRNVDTGAPYEIFLNDGATVPAAIPERKEIFSPATWPPSSPSFSFYPSADGTMAGAQGEAGAPSFAGDPIGFENPGATGNLEFTTEPAKQDMLFVGIPQLDLAASVTVPRVYLIGTLYDQDAQGERRRLTQCAMNPELRDGLETVSPVTPGQEMKLKPPCFPMAHHLRKGHQLVLRMTTSDTDKVPFFSVDPNITIFTGPNATVLKLPLIENATLYPDKFRLKIKGVGGYEPNS